MQIWFTKIGNADYTIGNTNYTMDHFVWNSHFQLAYAACNIELHRV